ERIRLTYRPVTMQSHRFLAEIRAKGVPRIKIASTSWRGSVEQEREDEAYSAFMIEVYCRIAVASSAARFNAGVPQLVYWFGVAVFVGVALVLAGLCVRGFWLKEWSGAAFIFAFFALFTWQLGTFFYRNRPIEYRPDALPRT